MVREADLIVAGGTVLTMDPDEPEAEAVACGGGRVLAAGRSSDVLVHAGEGTQVVRVPEDAVVLPGFVDAHMHVVEHGLRLLRLELGDAPGLDEVLSRVRQRAELTPANGWVIGNGWDESTWPDDPEPTRADLDAAAPDHPVLLQRVDMHTGVVNSPALERLDLDPDAFPDGRLVEDDLYTAVDAVTPSRENRVRAARRALQDALEEGVTSLHAIASRADLEVLEALRDQGNLDVRVTAYVRREALEDAEAGTLPTPREDPWLRVQGLKLFADGSLGARTAALEEPYADDPHEDGELLLDLEELTDLIARGLDAGLQPMVHAIGDRAIGHVLDAFEAADVPASRRPRIEHLELARDGHLERMRAAGAVASCQPNFVDRWSRAGGLYDDRLGEDHRGRDNRFARILEADVPLAFGSDGMPFGPRVGLRGATTGPSEAQRLPMEDALRAYTAGGATAGFAEHEKGRLEAGFRADLTVVSGDPRSSPEDVAERDVLLTVVDGAVVHDARDGTGPGG